MLRWPKAAGVAIAWLFRPLQDLDVYVEDIGDEAFYTELFRRIAPAGMRIARVVAKGNRESVILAAQAHNFHERAALFLVDGDLEWVRGDPPPPYVYRLEAYCIENLLIAESPLAQLLSEEEAIDAVDARLRLNFEAWVARASCLIELFIAFAVINHLDNAVPTISHGIGCLLEDGKPPSLAPAKVNFLRQEIEREIEKRIGAAATAMRLKNVRERLKELKRTIDAVSGKDFLVPLVFFLLSVHTRSKISRRSLRFRLARHADLEIFSELTAALVTALERSSIT